MRAVASELAVDAPAGAFDGVPGLKVPPATVPMAMRAMLLHTAVKAEADNLSKVDCATGITKVAKSMVVDMVDQAEAEKDKERRLAALDTLVLFIRSAEQLCEELAPDVEPETVVYEGSLKAKKLEELYLSYLERSVAEAQEQSAAAMAAMFSGSSEDSSMQAMEQKLALSEKRRVTLAKVCGLSEDKAQKLFEKKTQQELLAGLGNLGDLGKLADLGGKL